MIDAEQKGFIEADVIRELLITKGTPFREKEMEGTLLNKLMRLGFLLEIGGGLCDWKAQLMT